MSLSYADVAKKPFTIDDTLPEELVEQCVERAKQEVAESDVPVITVDSKPGGQQYVVMSMIGPNCNQKCSTPCVQFLGAFPTQPCATKFAENVSKSSPAFDIYVAEMYKWLPTNAKPEDAQNTRWRNLQVNNLMHEYMEQKAINKEIFEARKQACMDSVESSSEDKQEDEVRAAD